MELHYFMFAFVCVFIQDEAFDLWQQQWGRLYPDGSASKLVIDSIYKNYYLVNLVDNDFIKGNCLWEAVENTVRLRELQQNNLANDHKQQEAVQ